MSDQMMRMAIAGAIDAQRPLGRGACGDAGFGGIGDRRHGREGPLGRDHGGRGLSRRRGRAAKQIGGRFGVSLGRHPRRRRVLAGNGPAVKLLQDPGRQPGR